MSQDITWLGSSRNHVGPAGPTRTLQLPNPRQTTSPFTTPSGKSGSDQAPRRNANQSRSRSTDSSGVRALCQRTRSAGRATCGQRIGPCHACRTTAQSLNNLLRNPAYAGRIQSRRWNSEHEGDFDPIVSEALYSGVQARLAAINSHPSVRQEDDPDFPLRRFVRCAACDTPLTGSRSRGRSGVYPYYHCRNRCRGVASRKSSHRSQVCGPLGLPQAPTGISRFIQGNSA